MASRKALLIAAAAMAVVVVGALLPATASAEWIRVGDANGWDRDVDYDDWASGKTFRVGDILEFVYSAGSHNVVMLVDAANYEACTVPDGEQAMTSGDDRLQLVATGQMLFISSIGDDCDSGMKLAINVVM